MKLKFCVKLNKSLIEVTFKLLKQILCMRIITYLANNDWFSRFEDGPISAETSNNTVDMILHMIIYTNTRSTLALFCIREQNSYAFITLMTFTPSHKNTLFIYFLLKNIVPLIIHPIFLSVYSCFL